MLEHDWALTPHFRAGRGGATPRTIVLHTTDGTFDGTLNWFARPESRVSAHYVVGLDGRVVQLVQEADIALHAGRVVRPTATLATPEDPNRTSIGIEFDDDGRPHTVCRPNAQYEAGAELIAAIAARWGIPLDRDHVVGHREITASKTCPGNLDIEDLLERARRITVVADVAPAGCDDGRAPRLVCLLPARNAASDLPGWFASVEGLADAVVALDDGSTDDTAARLAAHPLVDVLLRNPRRDTYAGWDDSANRNRLLDAAAALRPDWVLFLDADERIPADDAAALRDFLATDALPGLAYGFRCFRMWQGGCDPSFVWVYRLFAYRAGQRLPTATLHFDPVPRDVPRAAYVHTTLRLQHWGAVDDGRRLARLAKYREADPEGHYPTNFGGIDGVPATVLPWLARSTGLGVLGDDDLLPAAAASVRSPFRGNGGIAARPRLVCLLPARNAASDLPGWFASVEGLADAVVALDDGSTDDTAARLAAHPLVDVLLRNPRRDTYAGWDDSANRNRLLDAAAALRPDWVLFLDADERIPADDAAALRDFLATDALPGLAYGFRCFRMVGPDRYDRDSLWVYRLFAFAPGLELPTKRLHFVPVPTAIPRTLWVRTTIRIQHVASLTAARRRDRFEKYRLADPDCEFQADYAHLLAQPRQVSSWVSRPPGLAVLALGDGTPADAPGDADIALGRDRPLLSAIVISRDDESCIERTVRSVVEQECDEPFEVIVVTSGTDRTAEIVRNRFPSARLVELDHPALPGEARNAGLRVAQGEYISFPGSHVELSPGSLAARLRAHDAGWGMVTGTLHNGTPTRAGWAAYFLDHSPVLPDRPSGPLDEAPLHCSYLRHLLLDVGGFPEHLRAGEDTVVNLTLFLRGHSAYRAADVTLVHHTPCRSVARLVRHHFTRGRGLTGVWDALRDGTADRASVRASLRGYLGRRVARIDANVAGWGGELRARYLTVRPLVRLAVGAAQLGAHAELWRLPRRGLTPSPAEPRAEDGPLTRALRTRPRPGDPEPERARAVFVHIPKTAGMTLERILEREYAPDPVYRIYGDTDDRIAQLLARPEPERRAIRAVAGHMGFGLARFLPGPSVCFTLLRDPVERLISHYFYVLATPDQHGHPRALEGIDSLEDYVRRSPVARLVNNGQARLLGGDVLDDAVPATAVTLARAKANLERDDVVVGLQDRFDESLLLVRRRLGWGWPAYRPENVGRARPHVDELDPDTVELIRSRNQLDLELYEHGRRLLERALAGYGEGLESDLELLRLAGRWPEEPPPPARDGALQLERDRPVTRGAQPVDDGRHRGNGAGAVTSASVEQDDRARVQ